MRRLALPLLVLVMTVLLFANTLTAFNSRGQGQNLVANPGFEDPVGNTGFPSYWQSFTGLGYVTCVDNGCRYRTDGDGQWRGIAQQVGALGGISPGATYQFSAEVKTVGWSSPDIAQFILTAYDPNWQPIKEKTIYVYPALGEQVVTARFRVDYPHTAVLIQYTAKGDHGGRVLLDNVSLVQQ